MFFRFLNFSPPCAAKAARASSTGVVSAVIAGGAGIVLAVLLGEPLAAGAATVALCAKVTPAEMTKRKSDGASFFISGSFGTEECEANLLKRRHRGNCSDLIQPGVCRVPSCATPSEGKSKIQVNLAITTAGAAA